jgi:xanthine/CO dehydrogenase XdhC/CoxF family maturation factor
MSDHATDILDAISTRKAQGEPFALATVVRTVAATAAKAGAKAVILPDGTMSRPPSARSSAGSKGMPCR